MKAIRGVCGILAALFGSLGCVGLVDHSGLWKSQVGGTILIMPAISIQVALRVIGIDSEGPNVMIGVSEGWPFLTVLGVVMVYVAPGLALGWCAVRPGARLKP